MYVDQVLFVNDILYFLHYYVLLILIINKYTAPIDPAMAPKFRITPLKLPAIPWEQQVSIQMIKIMINEKKKIYIYIYIYTPFHKVQQSD